MKKAKKHRSSGFSLVELMVVIAIIAILVALLIPGVNIVIRRARAAAIKMEVSNLAKALERYKLDFGEYPPDFTSGDPVTEINAHLLRKFRYRNANLDNPANDPNFPLDLARLDSLEALYFWLRGFSPDQQRPISGPGERTALFDFDQSRLTDRDGDGHPEYVPPRGSEIPYLYYRHNSYVQAVAWAEIASKAGLPLAKPYLSEVSDVAARAAAAAGAANPTGPNGGTQDQQLFFAEPKKYQIISAGLDGEFTNPENISVGKWYPGGKGYTPADRDNITSFGRGSTLEEDIP